MAGKAGKAKALVLFSGGLDSILAVRLLEEQGIGVEDAEHVLFGYGGRSVSV